MTHKKMYYFMSWLTIVVLILFACGQAAQSSSTGAGGVIGKQENEIVSAPTSDQAHDEQELEEVDHEAEHLHEETLKTIDLMPVSLAAGEKLQVLATTSIIGDLAGNVGGDLIDLTVMIPMGSDPHSFVPTPQDAAAVVDTDVVFVNGLNYEEFLEELIENAGGESPTVPLAAGVETRQLSADERNEQGHDHNGANPHVWTTPANAIIMVHNIKQALSSLDPANAKSYEANATAYEAELEALDVWVKSQIESIPAEKRKLVTDHDGFGYYAGHYGLEIIGAVIPAYSTGAEPSAQKLAELQDAIGEFDVKAVFVDTTVNPTLAQQLAKDTGIQLVPLYVESLGEAGSGAETYLDYIRYNTTAIVEALR